MLFWHFLNCCGRYEVVLLGKGLFRCMDLCFKVCRRYGLKWAYGALMRGVGIHEKAGCKSSLLFGKYMCQNLG